MASISSMASQMIQSNSAYAWRSHLGRQWIILGELRESGGSGCVVGNRRPLHWQVPRRGCSSGGLRLTGSVATHSLGGPQNHPACEPPGAPR
jgi:hypothetical protein